MYQTEVDGIHHELGTSGFLYRSNKLMYDHKTESYWSTLRGEPVVGPLVGKGIQLERGHVVTTSWGEWKKSNPDTTVLSKDTGHRRDYGEGVAYKNYFATHDLMFIVPERDDRLRNKDEVLALREADDQLAISAAYLKQHPVFHGKIAERDFVVLTDKSGANRVYESTDVRIKTWKTTKTAIDDQGRHWDVSAESLSHSDRILNRLPAHRAFWFGWYSQFPRTRLIK